MGVELALGDGKLVIEKVAGGVENVVPGYDDNDNPLQTYRRER